MHYIIAKMATSDWDAVQSIYQQGIATGNATFENEIPGWEQFDRTYLKECRFVAKKNDKVIGWCALSPVSRRRAYGGVAEVSIYIAASARGRGIGGHMLQHLIRASEDIGIWTLQAGIFPENGASIRIHKKYGFREVGVRERIGTLDGVWRDVVLMERRSQVAGL
jgi:phosphinothricin acetyltransferase